MTHTALSATAAMPQRLANWGRLLLLSTRVQWPFYVVALAYAATTLWFLHGIPSYQQAPLKGLAMGLISYSIPPGIVAVILFRLLQYAVVLKPEHPLQQIKTDLVTLFAKPASFITALPLLAAMVMFNKGMLELKPMIPLVKPFAFDQALMQFDRALHFGFDPWLLLQPLLGYGPVTFAISIAYNFWFLALFGTFMWFGFARSANATRTQFFLAYMLAWWIGGGLLAVFFSSAGPVYYGLLGHSPDPYAPLMAYLHSVDVKLPIWSLDAQDFLWAGYQGHVPPVGISAFPSMHNASATIFALAAWRQSRKAGIGFAIYAGIILVGSVHLGWHYAIDGYVGVMLGLIMWWIAGFIARWHGNQPSTRRLNEGLAAL